MIDYSQLAPRIIEGALSEVLGQRRSQAANALADKTASAIAQTVAQPAASDEASSLFDAPEDDAHAPAQEEDH